MMCWASGRLWCAGSPSRPTSTSGARPRPAATAPPSGGSSSSRRWRRRSSRPSRRSRQRSRRRRGWRLRAGLAGGNSGALLLGRPRRLPRRSTRRSAPRTPPTQGSASTGTASKPGRPRASRRKQELRPRVCSATSRTAPAISSRRPLPRPIIFGGVRPPPPLLPERRRRPGRPRRTGRRRCRRRRKWRSSAPGSWQCFASGGITSRSVGRPRTRRGARPRWWRGCWASRAARRAGRWSAPWRPRRGARTPSSSWPAPSPTSARC
mmetsp:Transcript_6314/g.14546  ORF Transcript_6314/g.14546 Transcript_6314/m.14546 type:complete len:265 (-) Transcript_6314:634-1428(-)